MKFAFVIRQTVDNIWAGDVYSISQLIEGLQKIGHEARLLTTLNDYRPDEYLILTNTSTNLRPNYWFTKLYRLKYGIIPFYEDCILYYGPSIGFYLYICKTLLGEEEDGYAFTLERLIENPDLIYYHASLPQRRSFSSYDILKDAEFIMVNSLSEGKIVKRDVPCTDPQIIPLIVGLQDLNPSDEFLSFTGLKKGEYILDVGRLCTRKNQLASIVATKDFEAPFVFICTRMFHNNEYDRFFFEAVRRWRKGSVWIISQTMKPYNSEKLKIIPMPGGEKLSESMLASAYANAALHLHPAFYELPGLTYFESAKLGIPTIASSWSSCADYFTDQNLGEYTLDERIAYCKPYDVRTMNELVLKKFGKTYPKEPLHPVFTRTVEEAATDFVTLLELKKSCVTEDSTLVQKSITELTRTEKCSHREWKT